MTLLTDIAPFVNDVGQVISAQDLIALRDNVATIDSLTYRRMPCFDSSGPNFDNTPGFYADSGNPFGYWRVWKGAVRWQTGVTTLNVNGFTKRSTGGSETLTIYANGVSQAVITTSVAGAAFSSTTTFTGYTDGQIISIEIRITGSSWGSDGKYVIYGIYADPISYTVTSWPGTPTFAGTYSAALLNQLVSATNWLYNRMAAVPMVAGLAQMYQLGPFNLAGNITANGSPIYYGGILRGYTEDTLTISFVLINATTPGVRYKVFLNGTLAATGPTRGPGAWSDPAVISLTGVTVGTRAEVSIFTEVVTENSDRAQWKFNYWMIQLVRAQPNFGAGLNYPYASLTAPPVGDVSISTATLNTFLNSLSTALANAKSRIDANTVIWARSYAMHERFSRGDSNTSPEDEQHRARPRLIRLSDRLIVSGKNVKLGYGPITVPTGDKGLQFEKYTHAHEETVIDTDVQETKIVYLDSYEGLFPGTAYFGVGQVDYMAEIL